MNWIDRYVRQIESCLPDRARADTAAEIRSLLQDSVCAQESALGRPLRDEETFALLKAFGHPLTVAAAYSDQGPLVSTALYPIYRLSLRYLATVLVAAWIVSVVGFYLNDRQPLWLAVGFWDAWQLGMFYTGVLTLGFHLADQSLRRYDLLSRWDPARLPPAAAERAPLLDTATALFFCLAWFVALSQVAATHSLDTLLGRTDNRLDTFVLWLKLQVLLALPVYVVLLVQPHWRRWQRALIIVGDALAVIGAGFALSIGTDRFAAQLQVLHPQSDSVQRVAMVSTLILVVWIGGLILDAANHGRQAWSGR